MRWSGVAAPRSGSLSQLSASMVACRCRQKCRAILLDTSNMTNLYAQVVNLLSPRKPAIFDRIAISASSLACWAMSSSSGPCSWRDAALRETS